jgi:hypothetical protein
MQRNKTNTHKGNFLTTNGRLDKVYLVYLSWCALVLVASYVMFFAISDITTIYSNKFQVAMFAGFLTLGSFLLTLKTFVVVQFKTQLFEKNIYEKVFIDTKSKATYRLGDYYQPLDDMAKLLLLAIISALATSLCQITIGFIAHEMISAFCIALGIATLCVVCFAWWVVRHNTLLMIQHWEQEKLGEISLREE